MRTMNREEEQYNATLFGIYETHNVYRVLIVVTLLMLIFCYFLFGTIVINPFGAKRWTIAAQLADAAISSGINLWWFEILYMPALCVIVLGFLVFSLWIARLLPCQRMNLYECYLKECPEYKQVCLQLEQQKIKALALTSAPKESIPTPIREGLPPEEVDTMAIEKSDPVADVNTQEQQNKTVLTSASEPKKSGPIQNHENLPLQEVDKVEIAKGVTVADIRALFDIKGKRYRPSLSEAVRLWASFEDSHNNKIRKRHTVKQECSKRIDELRNPADGLNYQWSNEEKKAMLALVNWDKTGTIYNK